MPDWTEKMKSRLEVLWHAGLSTSKIGEEMGVSKNAVVGAAHRMGLPPRPSPIQRGGAHRMEKPRRLDARPDKATPVPIEAIRRAQVAGPEFSESIIAAAERIARRNESAKPCCWPVGHPREPGFTFCALDAAFGRPYCPAHEAIAYVRAPRRQETAA